MASRNVTIAQDGDVTIKVPIRVVNAKELGSTTASSDGQIAKFLVRRDILAKNSDVFAAMLNGRFREAAQGEVAIDDVSADAMEVLFRVWHNKMTEAMYHLDIEVAWWIIKAKDKYMLDLTSLEGDKNWFGKWYLKYSQSKHEKEIIKCQLLLYPCYAFHHTGGFARITEHLAYNYVGHIHELNPTSLGDQHLRSIVIRKLCALSLYYQSTIPHLDSTLTRVRRADQRRKRQTTHPHCQSHFRPA